MKSDHLKYEMSSFDFFFKTEIAISSSVEINRNLDDATFNQ